MDSTQKPDASHRVLLICRSTSSPVQILSSWNRGCSYLTCSGRASSGGRRGLIAAASTCSLTSWKRHRWVRRPFGPGWKSRRRPQQDRIQSEPQIVRHPSLGELGGGLWHVSRIKQRQVKRRVGFRGAAFYVLGQ